MQIDPAAVLAVISEQANRIADLNAQVRGLQTENAELRAHLATPTQEEPT